MIWKSTLSRYRLPNRMICVHLYMYVCMWGGNLAFVEFQLNWLLRCDMLYRKKTWNTTSFNASKCSSRDMHTLNHASFIFNIIHTYTYTHTFTHKHIYINIYLYVYLQYANTTMYKQISTVQIHGLFRKPITLILLTWKETNWKKKNKTKWEIQIEAKTTIELKITILK